LISGEVNFLGSIHWGWQEPQSFPWEMCFFPLGTNLGYFFIPGTLFLEYFPAGRGSQWVCDTGVFFENRITATKSTQRGESTVLSICTVFNIVCYYCFFSEQNVSFLQFPYSNIHSLTIFRFWMNKIFNILKEFTMECLIFPIFQLLSGPFLVFVLRLAIRHLSIHHWWMLFNVDSSLCWR